MRELQKAANKVIYSLGMSELEHPIFYNCPVALRFEICHEFSTSPSYNAESAKKSAYKRVIEIYNALPFNFDILLFQIFGYRHKLNNTLDNFKSILHLGNPNEIVKSEFDDDATELEIYQFDCFWHIESQKNIKINDLLWEITLSDYSGGMSEFKSSVFLFDTKAEVLFYYYDDRGLDLCASRVETLQAIYERFNAYLLYYDRERMNSVFQ
jgi:hypothetical protein